MCKRFGLMLSCNFMSFKSTL